MVLYTKYRIGWTVVLYTKYRKIFTVVLYTEYRIIWTVVLYTKYRIICTVVLYTKYRKICTVVLYTEYRILCTVVLYTKYRIICTVVLYTKYRKICTAVLYTEFRIIFTVVLYKINFITIKNITVILQSWKSSIIIWIVYSLLFLVRSYPLTILFCGPSWDDFKPHVLKVYLVKLWRPWIPGMQYTAYSILHMLLFRLWYTASGINIW